MIKKVICALILLTIISSGCTKEKPVNDDLSVITQRGQLLVGIKTDTAPFGFLDKEGKNIGFDVDLARLIAKKLLGDENKVIFVPVNTANRIMKLSSGEADIIIATMSATPQRQMILDFSVPYHTAGQAIMVKNDSEISSLRELSGKKVIIVYGSTVEKNLRINVPNITIIGYKTYPEAYRALKDGKADAMISDDTILLGFAMNDPTMKILPKRYSKEPYAIAFRKGENSEKFREAVNIELKEALNKGIIKQMKAKWGIN